MTRIASILPPRENFTPEVAGAVALTVAEQVRDSRYGSETVVLGGRPGGMPGVDYRHILPRWTWAGGTNRAYARALVDWLRAHPDIILIEVHNRVPLFRRLRRLFPDRRVTLYLHNDPHGMDGLKTPEARRTVLVEADTVYCVSRFLAERLLDGTGASDAPVAVIYNGIDGVAADDGAPRDRQVLFVGRLFAEKGLMPLAEAMRDLLPAFPDWRFTIIGASGFGRTFGETPFEQALVRCLAPVAGQVDFLGHQPHAAVTDWFHRAAIATMPSQCLEAFGRVAVEAMAGGCAVVASRAGGLNEVMADSPWALDDVTPGNLKDRLRDLMANPAHLAASAAWSRAQAVRFSRDRQIARLDACRARLLGEAGEDT